METTHQITVSPNTRQNRITKIEQLIFVIIQFAIKTKSDKCEITITSDSLEEIIDNISQSKNDIKATDYVDFLSTMKPKNMKFMVYTNGKSFISEESISKCFNSLFSINLINITIDTDWCSGKYLINFSKNEDNYFYSILESKDNIPGNIIMFSIENKNNMVINDLINIMAILCKDINGIDIIINNIIINKYL